MTGGLVEIRHLRAFCAVAASLSFTQAAKELHYAQSTITEQIQALENELGVALFHRIGRKLTTTAAGDRLLSYAAGVLSLVEEARKAVESSAEEPSGKLVVGGLETLCSSVLPRLLSSYRQQFPQVKVALRQETRGELYAAVQGGKMDVCFTFGTPPVAAETSSEFLSEERLVIVVPPDHRLVGRDHVTLEDLSGEPFLVTERGCGFREMYDRALGAHGDAGPVVVAELGSIAALINCVSAGMGCALLPELAVSARSPVGVVRALMTDTSFRTTITMTWQRRWEEKPALAAFLRIADSLSRTTERSEPLTA